MKTSKTIQENAKRLTYHGTIVAALNASLRTANAEFVKDIENEIDINLAKIKFLIDNKTFNYNFKSGGWNSGYGTTIEEAIARELKRWNETLDNTTMDLESFRLANDSETEQLMSLFY